MRSVYKYQVSFDGNPEGFENQRALISLYGKKRCHGHIHFHDPEMTFSIDNKEEDGTIHMHLPSSMFGNVIDILRNEKPVYFFYRQNRAWLQSFVKPISEEEL